MHLKISSAKWRPFCLGLNELIFGVKIWKRKMLLLSDGNDLTFQANLIVDIDYHKDSLDVIDGYISWKDSGSDVPMLPERTRGIRTFLKQYNCYESATIWYTDHQYLAQYSEIINNLQKNASYILQLCCAQVTMFTYPKTDTRLLLANSEAQRGIA